jgi:tetratricopeptide (TPR) repeat protein
MAKKKNNTPLKVKAPVQSRKSVLPVFLIIALAILFIYFAISVSHIQDDTFITLRYVKNILAGSGPVFNAGERVEGYTSFLWTAILTICGLCKLDIADTSQYLSTAFGVVSIVFLYLLSKQIYTLLDNDSDRQVFPAWSRIVFTILPAALLTATSAFYYWSVSGMETSLFVCCVIASVYFYLTSKYNKNNAAWLSVSLVCACLTRPEGYLIAGILLANAIVRQYWNNDSNNTAAAGRKLFSVKGNINLIVFIVPVVAHEIFRLVYYGNIFPNTFYAKAGFSTESLTQGFSYAWLFCKDYLLYGVVFVVPLSCLFFERTKKTALLLYSIIIPYSAYVIIIGGDVLALERFWLPVLPFIYILLTMTIYSIIPALREKKSRMPSAIAAVLMLMLPALAVYNYFTNAPIAAAKAEKEKGLIEQFIEKAVIFNTISTEEHRQITVAATTIGALSYYSDAAVIDMLGLTDATIAHHPKFVREISNDTEVSWKEKKYNAEYIISRKPDYIVFSTGIRPSAYAEHALFVEKGFYTDYHLQLIPFGYGKYFYVYAKKTIKQLAAHGSTDLQPAINPAFEKNYVHIVKEFDLLRNERTGSFEAIQTEFAEGQSLYPPYFSDSYRILGDAAFLAGTYDKSEEYYNQALSIDSTNILTYIGMGYLYKKLGKNQELVNLLQKVEELSLIDFSVYPQFNLYGEFGLKRIN